MKKTGENIENVHFFCIWMILLLDEFYCNNFYERMDLNLIVEEDSNRDDDRTIDEKIKKALELGFNIVAITVRILPEQIVDIPSPPAIPKDYQYNKNVYTRLTVAVSDPIQIYKLNQTAESKRYDLLALEPLNKKMLSYLCGGPSDFDILTFSFEERVDFSLFKVSFKILETRGVCLEINYSKAQAGSTFRRNIICGGQNLIEKSRKNIILSSGTSDIFRLRNPKDVVSLGPLFFLPSNLCHSAVYKAGHRAIKLSKIRKNQVNAAIEMVQEAKPKKLKTDTVIQT